MMLQSSKYNLQYDCFIYVFLAKHIGGVVQIKCVNILLAKICPRNTGTDYQEDDTESDRYCTDILINNCVNMFISYI
jgi:hypothetical protein